MRGKSHRCLGEFLAERYLPHVPKHCTRAFLIGCVEPDRNPVTYLKGSVRFQWLRGHNYRNARSYMRQISRRLEKKERMNLIDYYTLGKLIHYIADAFTYAHNEHFSENLAQHREYEAAFQEHFLKYLQDDPKIRPLAASSIMEAIYSYHREYEANSVSIHTDAGFVLNSSCCVLALVADKSIL